MKLSDKSHNIFSPAILAWVFPILLIIPNIALAITELDPFLVKATDIVLPLGVYYGLMALSVKVPRTVLWCLPLMVLAAFQIVLLYLYGESIIAIDMFINVVTSNPKEISELLGNLLIAIFTVVVIYLPPIVWAVVAAVRKMALRPSALPALRRTGLTLSSVGVVLLATCFITVPKYDVTRDIFPVNVIYNMCQAVVRTADTANYSETSAGYDYHARSVHDAVMPEVYIMVIGETSRADNWQLFGYDRPTNPKLSRRDGLVTFPKTLSQSNTTHKSVPMLISPLDATSFGDSICLIKGIPAAFRQAGFSTAFISNQRRNHSFIDFFGETADSVVFIRDSIDDSSDMLLIDRLERFIASDSNAKKFIILHCYGSHFNYRERYTRDHARFLPDDASEASLSNRQALVNAYDNTIIFTDDLLARIIDSLDSLDVASAMIYTSDHGEDIFDDPRGRFLHASPTPTFRQLHVPYLIWTSDEYRSLFPEKVAAASANSNRQIASGSTMFDTILSLAGISSDKYRADRDLCSPDFRESPRLYLNDYNEAVPLGESGLRSYDIQKAKSENISIE